MSDIEASAGNFAGMAVASGLFIGLCGMTVCRRKFLSMLTLPSEAYEMQRQMAAQR